jgi:hypothetical protein
MLRKSFVLSCIITALALMETGRTAAQRSRDPLQRVLVKPTVLTGPDVGFRIMRWEGKTPVGQLVVKVDGVWIEAKSDDWRRRAI